ncbi:MAG: hypothetical protein ACJAWA_000011 [Nonlabens sp.]|jgi:hypothetical protein
MKTLLPLFLFCLSLMATSQDIIREKVEGKIIVEGSDIKGITIYNTASKIGATTNEKGAFQIEVALNDLIEVRAVEHQNFDVKVSSFILKSKKMLIFLIEEVKKLDEVIVKTNKLSGNINNDLKKANSYQLRSNVLYFGIKDKEIDFTGKNKKQIENIAAVSNAKTMVTGLNVINVVDQLLIPLFRSEVEDKKAAGVPEVPVKSIKYYLGSTLLVENFDIPEHRVEEFIRYVEDDTFDFNLLNYGNEIEFLELLSKKSKVFLNNK